MPPNDPAPPRNPLGYRGLVDTLWRDATADADILSAEGRTAIDSRLRDAIRAIDDPILRENVRYMLRQLRRVAYTQAPLHRLSDDPPVPDEPYEPVV